MPPRFDRRTFVKMVGAAGAGAALAGQAGGSPEVSTRVVDEQFDLDGGLQEALVVFDDADDAARLDALDLAEPYHVFEELGIAWTFLEPDQVETVAGWEAVRRVKRAEELEWHNDDVSRESMAVDAVHGDLGYLGEDAHVVLIDSGLNASHPGIGAERVDGNYHYVDEPTGPRAPFWADADAGDTDTVGHGQHCAGIAAGNGEAGTQGTYEGMAPAATITSYGTVQGVYLPYVVAAWEHLLGRIRTEPEFQPDVVSNSYGVSRGDRYNPNDPVNVASWKVFEEGVLPLFSYGNDGPGEGTGNRFAKAPHVLGVGAAQKTIDDEDNRNDRPITDFSSRGRSNVDPVYYDRERILENLREFHAIQDGTTYTVNTGTFTGSVGPAVNTSPGVSAVDEDTGSAFEHLDTHENVDLVDLTLSLEPEGQWVRMRVYEQQGDRWIEVAQLREEPLKQHDTLTFDVNGGLEYLIELEPEIAVAADYTIEYTQYAKPDGNMRQARPLTLYRPGLSAHGNAVLSTQDKYDVLGPLGETVDREPHGEPFYGRLSGTSMSCPAAAGIAMLVRQAYREECDGDELPPADVIRVMEHTAVAHNPDYSVVNTGSGFVDAAAAVRTAERLARGELSVADLDTGLDALVDAPDPTEPPTDLEAAGSREVDRSVSTGGRTMRVDVTLEDLNDAAGAVEVYDEIPGAWDLLEEFSQAREVETADGRTRIQLLQDGTDPTVDAGEVDGEEASVTFTYFVESPGEPGDTNRYTFGPAEAVVETWAVDEGSRGTEASEFGGTADVFVAGVSV